MDVQQLAIGGSLLFSPVGLADSRGLFLEAFSASAFRDATGASLELAQVNLSVSKKGVIRGVHFTRRTPGQAKYVMCVQGRIRDVVVDLRPDSITFGQWDSAVLDDLERRAMFIEAGLGHAFQVLSDSATVVYIASTPYDPDNEFSISPLDPELDLPWDLSLPQRLSARDSVAPSFGDFFGDSRTRT